LMSRTKKVSGKSKFHLEFKNSSQKLAWNAFQQHDILFLVGPAGAGKTFLTTAFAVEQLKEGSKRSLILTRPIKEAGEKLGFLPGDFNEKVDPYMQPLYDSLSKLVGREGPERAVIDAAIEVAPLAYLRGRTFEKAICVLDEAQNCTKTQLKMYLTRLGEDSKMIINGDMSQCDIPDSGLQEVIDVVSKINGVGVIEFTSSSVVRHRVVRDIVDLL
jgi:phosphate starvation-inducible PhoH-like protein